MLLKTLREVRASNNRLQTLPRELWIRGRDNMLRRLDCGANPFTATAASAPAGTRAFPSLVEVRLAFASL